MRKLKNILFALILALPFHLLAQQYEKYDGNNIGWSLNANFGPTLFYGDIKQYRVVPLWSSYNNEVQEAGGLILAKQLFPFLDLRAQVLGGWVAGTKLATHEYFTAGFVDYNVNLKVDISEFFKPEKDRIMTYYAYAGVGAIYFRTKKFSSPSNNVIASYGYNSDGGMTKGTTEGVVPFGIGADYKVSYNVSMNIDYSRRVVNSDKLDATVAKSKHDMYDYLSVGVTYHFRGPKDSDNDGVPDKTDKCPDTPMGVSVDEN
jgi:hypothetical protein